MTNRPVSSPAHQQAGINGGRLAAGCAARMFCPDVLPCERLTPPCLPGLWTCPDFWPEHEQAIMAAALWREMRA